MSNYGTQEVKKEDEESEKDLEAILFGIALHYTLEMLGAFTEESLAGAMNALQNKYGQVLHPEQREAIRKRVSALNWVGRSGRTRLGAPSSPTPRDATCYSKSPLRQSDRN